MRVMKKQVPCPVCGFGRLIDEEVHNKTEVKAETMMPPGWIPNYFQKCPRCKNQIGIKNVS